MRDTALGPGQPLGRPAAVCELPSALYRLLGDDARLRLLRVSSRIDPGRAS